MNPEFIVSSDEDDVCKNTKRRIHPYRQKVFKKNMHVEETEWESENDEEMMNIPEEELDFTAYDHLTRMYSLARKGKVTLTQRSLEVRGVYRGKRFITVLVCNFYLSVRAIPYMKLMRCDGVGGVVGRKFLYEMKRMESDEDSPLERLWIDLNKLANWGTKGIIYGDRSDRFWIQSLLK